MKNYLKNSDRIHYYCGGSLNRPVCYNKNFIEDTSFFFLNAFKNDNNNSYEKDLIHFIKKNKLEVKFTNGVLKYCPRDRVELFTKIPTLVKSRVISEDEHCSILVKMNTTRHFQNLNDIVKKDVPFHQKKNALVWRGATTGYGFGNHIPIRSVSRETLVKKYCNEASLKKGINVGLSKIIQEAKKKEKDYEKFLRPTMTFDELLQYKYILSVEGNDVATNTKWIMCSNSVLFMPKPQIESWFLESKLVPFVHYIPVNDDFSNLETQIKWCDQNPKKCKEIIKNANDYVKIFLDEKNENKIMKSVLEAYLKNVQFV